jgi:hypothetical protein
MNYQMTILEQGMPGQMTTFLHIARLLSCSGPARWPVPPQGVQSDGLTESLQSWSQIARFPVDQALDYTEHFHLSADLPCN